MIRSRPALPATLVSALLLTATAIPAVTARAATPEAQIAESTAKLQRVKARISEVSTTIEKDRHEQDAAQAALEDAEKAEAQARELLRASTGEVDKQTLRVHDAHSQRDDAQHHVDEQKAALAAQVRAAYMIGSGGEVELAFGQDDPGRISRMIGYYSFLDRARADRIQAISNELQHLAEMQQHYDEQIRNLQQVQEQRRQAFNELQAKRVARAQAVSAVQQRITGEAEELKQLRSSEAQIESLLSLLKKALAGTPLPGADNRGFQQQRAHMQWPLKGPLLASYGDPKAEGRLTWKGLWIGADEGTPVHACARGRVAYVGWMTRYGLIVVIEHENGYFSLYGHTSAVNKAAGDTVEAGDVIASAGSTGGYDKPGLYFEIRKGTEPIDPRPWLHK
jgi:septal ring factor EnvC (AmiA/AmiB activator)